MVLTDEELRHCTVEKARAKDQVRAFFDACVPKHRRHLFMEFADRLMPELAEELRQLRATIDKPPESVISFQTDVNRYVFISKEIIKKVSINLVRAICP